MQTQKACFVIQSSYKSPPISWAFYDYIMLHQKCNCPR